MDDAGAARADLGVGGVGVFEVTGMTTKRPQRHWRSYGDDPVPTGKQALNEPFAAFPSWYLRITCDRCGKDRMLSETHTPQRDLPIREMLRRMRHDGCGG
jgi:hypothetical protein